jgi:hypothetical protein
MLNLGKSYRESDSLARQYTNHGKRSSSKLYVCITRRAMKNADMFGHHTVRHELSHLETTYYQRHVRQSKNSTFPLTYIMRENGF